MNDIDIKLYLIGNEPYDEQQPMYVPFELVNRVSNDRNTILIQKLVHNLVAPHHMVHYL